jgi:hypothetical protein
MSSTIIQQINAGRNLVVTDKGFHLHRLIEIDSDTAMIINVQSIMSQYRNELKKHIKRYELSDADIKKYNFKPELLCYEVYGTVELAPFILQINNMVSVTEFTNLRNGLNMFDNTIFDFLNEILIKEKVTVQLNRDELEKDLSS